MPTHWAMHTELPAAIEGLEAGREFTIALNRLYLRECLQALSVVSSQSLEMRLNEPQSPILMQPDGLQNSYVLLMPMQLRLSEHLRLRSTT